MGAELPFGCVQPSMSTLGVALVHWCEQHLLFWWVGMEVDLREFPVGGARVCGFVVAVVRFFLHYITVIIAH